MGFGITLNHIEAGKEERMMSGSTCELEKRLMSQDQRLEEEVQRQVAIAMSQQQQAQTVPPEPNVVADHMSQLKSSCDSTDVAVEPTGIQAAVEAMAPQ